MRPGTRTLVSPAGNVTTPPAEGAPPTTFARGSVVASTAPPGERGRGAEPPPFVPGPHEDEDEDDLTSSHAYRQGGVWSSSRPPSLWSGDGPHKSVRSLRAPLTAPSMASPVPPETPPPMRKAMREARLLHDPTREGFYYQPEFGGPSDEDSSADARSTAAGGTREPHPGRSSFHPALDWLNAPPGRTTPGLGDPETPPEYRSPAARQPRTAGVATEPGPAPPGQGAPDRRSSVAASAMSPAARQAGRPAVPTDPTRPGRGSVRKAQPGAAPSPRQRQPQANDAAVGDPPDESPDASASDDAETAGASVPAAPGVQPGPTRPGPQTAKPARPRSARGLPWAAQVAMGVGDAAQRTIGHLGAGNPLGGVVEAARAPARIGQDLVRREIGRRLGGHGTPPRAGAGRLAGDGASPAIGAADGEPFSPSEAPQAAARKPRPPPPIGDRQ